MSSYSDINGLNYSTTYDFPNRGQAARVFDRNPVTQEILLTLTGAAAGSTALVANKRVQHSTSELGGVRTIETENKINRVTTSADVTAMSAMVNRSMTGAVQANLAGLWLGKAA